MKKRSASRATAKRARKPVGKARGGKASAKKPRSARPESKAVVPTRPPRAVVGVVAPSSPAPQVELELGANRLIAAGFEVFFHPQVR